MKVVVVTPYHREPPSVLQRCIDSVAAQTVPSIHYMVADGFPSEVVEKAARGRPEQCRHIVLDRAHADFGNTPRAMGALLAITEQEPDAVAFLDADNWYDASHVKECRAAARGVKDADWVIAQRRLVRPDGSVLAENFERPGGHVDTSCYFLLRGAFHAIPQWILQPPIAKKYCDVFFLNLLADQQLNVAVTSTATVNYTTLWKIHYEMKGEDPPQEAKPNFSDKDVIAWWRKLGKRDKQIVTRLLGYTPRL